MEKQAEEQKTKQSLLERNAALRDSVQDLKVTKPLSGIIGKFNDEISLLTAVA